jgi:hypothetical protein
MNVLGLGSGWRHACTDLSVYSHQAPVPVCYYYYYSLVLVPGKESHASSFCSLGSWHPLNDVIFP